jgi:acyl carrier protein
MDQKEVFDTVISILKPFAKDPAALAQAGMGTLIMKDLRVNSARLVDVVLELEERFGIQVKDEEAHKVRPVGDAVNLVVSKAG